MVLYVMQSLCTQCSNEKEKRTERLVSEDARSFNAIRGSGERCNAKRHLVHFWSENALSGKALDAARGSGDRCKLSQFQCS